MKQTYLAQMLKPVKCLEGDFSAGEHIIAIPHYTGQAVLIRSADFTKTGYVSMREINILHEVESEDSTA